LVTVAASILEISSGKTNRQTAVNENFTTQVQRDTPYYQVESSTEST